MSKGEIHKELFKIYLKALNSRNIEWVKVMLKDIEEYIYKLIN